MDCRADITWFSVDVPCCSQPWPSAAFDTYCCARVRLLFIVMTSAASAGLSDGWLTTVPVEICSCSVAIWLWSVPMLVISWPAMVCGVGDSAGLENEMAVMAPPSHGLQ
jgi:hypothetical protein